MAKRKRHCKFGVVKTGRRKGSCLKTRRARKGGLSGARRRHKHRR